MKTKEIIAALLLLLAIAACSEDEPSPSFSTATYQGEISINPNNFPSGAGLNLTLGDTGKVVQLDDEAAFEWDIKIMTIRTGQGGRPGIFLFGDTQSNVNTQAVNVSENFNIGLGLSGFNAFSEVSTAMQNQLSADGTFNFDPKTDTDGSGKPDADKLATAYQSLVIGDRVVNLQEESQPVFLVKGRSGAIFKFQMVNRENGGKATLRWSRFALDVIE
ncbi:hypothetical protein [Roseivirga spongicola]|uniref:hypothetical protein n=1 Tax=Roseivirga spongicola TaxID=333140 RepID=UPI002AC8B643|nr:hypothetical protein [Roseivirga spongicola]WPZ09154.1 hypothetical protein T7867_12895 [Roseivirga spongicola]